jgi:hypothetical protein
MPGFEHTYDIMPFHPYFLKNIGRYKVLGFMDWMHTNNNEQKEWGDRPLESWSTFSNGVGKYMYVTYLQNSERLGNICYSYVNKLHTHIFKCMYIFILQR